MESMTNAQEVPVVAETPAKSASTNAETPPVPKAPPQRRKRRKNKNKNKNKNKKRRQVVPRGYVIAQCPTCEGSGKEADVFHVWHYEVVPKVLEAAKKIQVQGEDREVEFIQPITDYRQRMSRLRNGFELRLVDAAEPLVRQIRMPEALWKEYQAFSTDNRILAKQAHEGVKSAIMGREIARAVAQLKAEGAIVRETTEEHPVDCSVCDGRTTVLVYAPTQQPQQSQQPQQPSAAAKQELPMEDKKTLAESLVEAMSARF